jgi:hypothetical protein
LTRPESDIHYLQTQIAFYHLNNMQIEINNYLQILDQWEKTWLVDFNPNKTKALILSNNTNIRELSIRFHDESVELVDNHKHLGITFASDNEVSSANSLANLPRLSVMSLIYNTNNNGLSTDT